MAGAGAPTLARGCGTRIGRVVAAGEWPAEEWSAEENRYRRRDQLDERTATAAGLVVEEAQRFQELVTR